MNYTVRVPWLIQTFLNSFYKHFLKILKNLPKDDNVMTTLFYPLTVTLKNPRFFLVGTVGIEPTTR